MTQSVKEIKEKWLELHTDERKNFIAVLRNDSRKGVQSLVTLFEKELQRENELHKLFNEMSKIESRLYNSGVNLIAGADEVGRGCLGGPVVAASVVLPKDCYIPGLNDSKKLTENAREKLFEEIKAKAISIGVGIVKAKEIDEINIYQASKKAMELAIAELNVKPDHLLIDAMSLDLPIPQEAIIKGDSKSISIAASSVVAKVIRDRMMLELSEEYPDYGFDQHKGYGTKQHITAIINYGICPAHRRSFDPIKSWLED